MSDSRPMQSGDDSDAQLDALLIAAGEGVRERLADAIDVDAGRAAIFKASVVVEDVPACGEQDTSHLAWLLPSTGDSLIQWLAVSAPGYLPQQLDKAMSTIRTMTVVGRALLPESLRPCWGLATDFLTECRDNLVRLKTGLAHRELTREEALTLQYRVRTGIGQVRGTLRQANRSMQGPDAACVIERLISTSEMILILLGWTRQGIEQLFADTEQTLQCPTR
ncbi:hypothetical protein ACWGGS_12885 [Streptomyces decoyicus]